MALFIENQGHIELAVQVAALPAFDTLQFTKLVIG